MLQTTYKIMLFKNRKLKNGAFPVVLQVMFLRKPKRFTLGKNLWCFENDWNEAAGAFKKSAENYREKNAILDKVKHKVNEILFEFERDKQPFSFEAFEDKLTGNEKKQVYSSFDKFLAALVEEMRAQSKLGNAKIYHDFGVALNNYRSTSKIVFSDINYNFLKGFETHFYKRGCTGGGIHHYMRTLRAIFNEAIRRGLVSKDLYPFKSQLNPNGYSLMNLKSEAAPRAVSLEDIERIKQFDIKSYPQLNLPWKVFLFSYYAFGLNFADLVVLKKTNIQNGRIVYRRAKTGKEYSVAITEPMQAILNEFARKESLYLFPFLTETIHQTPLQIMNRKHKVMRQINDGLKVISDLLDLPASLTTYVARHTFATTLKDKGVNVAIISECLGHSDLSTTQAYLKKFEQSKLDEVALLL
ncbi:MAG: tyrosine-type recombinase/integrase [Bacteroidetes bacterium]|nr:tyrosine-type recombinase/integrase [Bacteroidota bacterium]